MAQDAVEWVGRNEVDRKYSIQRGDDDDEPRKRLQSTSMQTKGSLSSHAVAAITTTRTFRQTT